MRKFLIVAVAAVAVVAFAAVALAQGADTATLTTKLTPKNAGTKTKPTNAKLDLSIVNGNTKRTMSALDIFMPKTMRISIKGMPMCSNLDVAARNCPTSTILGHGNAKALVGVNGPTQTDLTFDVKAVKTGNPNNGGKPMLGFVIDNGGQQFLAEAKLTKAGGKYGQKLHLDVPPLAQHIGTTYNGLVSLRTVLSKKKGKNKLVATTGCKNKKQPFKVVLTFIDNGVTTATKYGDTSTSKCTK